MEGDGERIHQVPPTPRRKILRAGIRIVAEQFASYSEEPDEEEILVLAGKNLRISAIGITAQTIQAGSISAGRLSWKASAMQKALEEMAKTNAPIVVLPSVMDELSQATVRLNNSLHEAIPEPPPERDGRPKDRRPKKKKKQTEPYYVKLTRFRHRR